MDGVGSRDDSFFFQKMIYSEITMSWLLLCFDQQSEARLVMEERRH